MEDADKSLHPPDDIAKVDSQASHTSSFPISSPTFWTEAANVATSIKRSLSPTPLHEVSPESSPAAKKARYNADTSLSYLPNRLDPLLDETNPHAYLAQAEYAPNKFGDIGDYMRKKEIKVQTQNRDIALASALEGIPQIFVGQSFYINGNTHPPMEELRKMILQRGGEVRPVLRSKGMVKYIIAPMLTQSKFKQFERYKVVREGWILESCKQGKMLDWSRWKLQPQGGWQEEGRKGLEGFLAGQSQAVKEELREDDDEADEEVSEEQPFKTPLPIFVGTQSLLRPPSTAAAPRSLLAAPSSTSRSTRMTGRPHASLAPAAETPNLPRSPDVPTRQNRRLPQPPAGLGRHVAEPTPPINPIVAPDSVRRVSPTAKVVPLATDNTPIGEKEASVIPISPGAEDGTQTGPEVPPKVQRPEGGWEFYHSKESNTEAARLLKNQEWRLKNTAERGNEGGFIDGYYQNSRLHHLSTWKAELRVLVAAAQQKSEEQSLSKPSSATIAPFSLANSALPRAAQNSAAIGEKVIFHVDFDCFFVSCGLATRPHLKGKPAVVCHSQTGKSASSTSEIASASYEARAKGVRNGMSLGRARQLVGEGLETIPYEFETYKRFSLSFYTVLMGYADELQAVSVDEALIDVTSAVAARAAAPEEAVDGKDEVDGENKPRDPAIEVAEKIRDEVRALTEGCEVSIGIAHNILLAKLGTRKAKPAGVHHVVPAEVEELLAPLDVEDLPSIGNSTRSKVEEKFGSTVCGELLKQPKGAFRALLGPKTGEMLWGYLRGLDDRKLEPHKERKSISAEMNYGIRFQSDEQAEICIADLAAEVAKRMKSVNAKGRLLTLKLMSRHPDAPVEPPKFLGHGWCETFNKSAAIGDKGGSATDNPGVLATESVKLLRSMKLDPKELRGVGIQITKLDGEKAVEREAGQGTLSFGVKRKVEQVDGPKVDAVEAGEATPPFDVPPDSPTASPRAVSPPATRQRTALLEEDHEEIAGPSRTPDSSDGIDPDFLAALPPELRQEVKRDFAIARGRPPAPAKRSSTERAATESPTKIRTKHAAAHITRQLRPKVKTQMKASAVAETPLYGAWARAADEPVDLTADVDEDIGGYRLSELRELGIDAEVFTALPDDMRKEIILEERKKHRHRKILHRPADTSRLRAKTRADTRTASLSPSRAGSVPLHSKPLIAVSLAPRPTLLKASTLPDVLETITRWIDSRKGGPPAEKDASKVQTYLVKCFDGSMGVGAAENAVEALKWMRLELSERWPEAESGEVGSIWQATWRRFVDAVNAESMKRFGALVRL